MRRIILLILITVFALSAKAQEATFTWTDIENNTKVGCQNPTFAFPSEEGYTIYSIEKSGTQVFAPTEIHIAKYYASGEVQSALVVNLPKRQQKDATLLKVIEANDKLYIFSFIAVKKDAKNVLYCQIYNDETRTVSEVKELYALPIERVNNSGFFEVQSSEDQNTFAVLINKPFEKKTKESIEILILDENLEALSNTKQTLSFDSKRAYREELFVEDDGTVVIIKKTNIFKKNPITTAIIIKDNVLIEQQISDDKFYISDNRVVTINSKQYLIGFATDNVKPAISMGGAKDKSFFIYNLSDKVLIKNGSWKPEILKKILGKGFLHLTIKDILIHGEDLYLVGDCFSEKSTMIEGKNFEYNYDYNFGPGVVVKLNINGDVAYQTLIKYGESYKNQENVLGSFYPYLDNGNLKLLANEKTSTLKKKKIVMGHGNINAKTMVLLNFDSSGNSTIVPFWNSKVGGKNDLVSFAPGKSRFLKTNTFYIYAMGNTYYRYGKMTID